MLPLRAVFNYCHAKMERMDKYGNGGDAYMEKLVFVFTSSFVVSENVFPF